ncbi:MAG: M23 family metallopeptidase [Candidatus Gracilibacteria bacterium]
MLSNKKWTAFMAIVLMAILGIWGCTRADGTGSADSFLKLPFQSGEYWLLTQGYNQGSHVDYGFDYGNDTYALDFTQNGCNAYGDPVTPMADGMVMEIATEGNGDHGYGNTVLMDHGDGYVSRYGHLSEIWVSEGDTLDDSDALGAVGNTGYSIGSACGDHPGTHLHVAFYKDAAATKPEPLSGNTDLSEYCWYNREGDMNCDGGPEDYSPVEETDDYSSMAGEGEEDETEEDGYEYEDEGEDEIQESDDDMIKFLDISPDHGTAEETEFVWAAIVESESGSPRTMLVIYNPNDGTDYEFEMETDTPESPYVFTYKKTLRDDDTEYVYWVRTQGGDDEDVSDTQSIEVEDSEGDVPSLSFETYQSGGDADETEFEWSTYVESDDEPTVLLNIVSAADRQIYSFEMDVDEEDHDRWFAEYEKTLRDPVTYTFWMTAENHNTVTAGSVLSMEVE